jgi:drug/metabolite transporter (DMT)-like permease
VSAAAAVVTRVTGHSLFGAPTARHLLAARAIMGLIASSGFIYSLSVLPLSAAASINFSTPLFTALLSTIILQEPWNPRVIAGTPSSLVCTFPSLTISVLQCRGLTPNRIPVSLFVDSFERG